MNTLLITSITVVVLSAGHLTTTKAAAISTFDSGAEGWTVVNFTDLSNNAYTITGTNSPTFTASGGNPGGYISSADPDTSDFTFSAPAAFRSGFPTIPGGMVSYDLTHTGTVDYQTSDVILEGGGLRLLWQSSPALNPNSGWTTVSFNLAPSPQWHLGTTTGALASNSDFATVLANVSGFYVRGEYTNGLGETAGVDNVRVQVPEPSSELLLFLGAAACAHRRSLRRNETMA